MLTRTFRWATVSGSIGAAIGFVLSGSVDPEEVRFHNAGKEPDPRTDLEIEVQAATSYSVGFGVLFAIAGALLGLISGRRNRIA